MLLIMLRLVVQDEFGRAFGDHDYGRVGVPRNKARHDRGIGDPDVVDASYL